MAAELILAPETQADIAEAYAWYEARRAGPGEEFLGCLDACIPRPRQVASPPSFVAASGSLADRTPSSLPRRLVPVTSRFEGFNTFGIANQDQGGRKRRRLSLLPRAPG